MDIGQLKIIQILSCRVFWNKEISYVSLDEFKMMVEANSTMLLPYETHYHFFLTALSSRLIQ